MKAMRVKSSLTFVPIENLIPTYERIDLKNETSMEMILSKVYTGSR